MTSRWPLTRPTALNLGAGSADQLRGALRLDRTAAVRPHVVADLDTGSLPFRDGSFSEVGAYDVVEHVANLVALVEEVHRVLKPGGRLFVTTPHFSSANAYTDPTHGRSLGLRSFDYFTAAHPLAYYASAQFRLREAKLYFRGRVLGRLAFHLARRWPDWYEAHLAWIVPAWFMTFDLEAIK